MPMGDSHISRIMVKTRDLILNQNQLKFVWWDRLSNF